eukprot:gb/GEZJ01006535.1/.p1 GENE.gb/GEZJ01006535.1/~~gb/GEZJ01006535.1/.p1  ORF type:complete len:124 (+),score=3.51 gb/GEZJ01006535.1/:332-703(+)
MGFLFIVLRLLLFLDHSFLEHRIQGPRSTSSTVRLLWYLPKWPQIYTRLAHHNSRPTPPILGYESKESSFLECFPNYGSQYSVSWLWRKFAYYSALFYPLLLKLLSLRAQLYLHPDWFRDIET